MQIVDFAPEHASAFRALNEAWITRHFALEPRDVEILDDPQGEVVDAGGRIFMALDGETPVGCVAMMRLADGGYEVAKMTVADGLRGSGIGRALMQRCIDVGAELGAPRLYLETNAVLAPALSLYRSVGFRDLPPKRTAYARADVFMERRY